jgi:hypothetical protein
MRLLQIACVTNTGATGSTAGRKTKSNGELYARRSVKEWFDTFRR